MGMTAEQYARQLKQLLPPGRLWNLLAGSWIEKVLLAIGDEFERVDTRGSDLVDESFPSTTDEMLSEWEAALGLPDDCDEDLSLTDDERRDRITEKLISRGGQTPQFFIDMADVLGVTVTIDEGQYTNLRCGVAECGSPLGGLGSDYEWTVNIPSGFLTDSSGNGYTLTENGTVAKAVSATDGYGFEAEFDGNNSNYLSRNGNAFDFDANDPFTVEAWVNLGGVAGSIMSRWGSSFAQQQWHLRSTGTSLQVQVKQINTATIGPSKSGLTAGRHHVALVHSGTQIKIFVDGVGSSAQNVFQGIQSVVGEDFRIGYTPAGGNSPADGTIDELRVSNSARYWSDFTPPTEPFETDANTIALYHFGVNQPGLECRIERAAPAHTLVAFNYGD